MNYTLTVQEIQTIIHFFTDKQICAYKIKGYFNVKKSKLQGEKL